MESRKNILYSRASQSLFTTTIAPMRVSSPIAAMGSSRQFGGAARAGGRISAFAQPRTSSQGPSRAALNIPTISMSMKGMNESETFQNKNSINRNDMSSGLQAQSKRPLALGNQAKMVSETGSMANLEQRNKFVVNAKTSSFQGNSKVIMEQSKLSDPMAAKMSTDFKQPMQQARDYNLASKVENINKISKQWVESISKVMDNQFKVTGDKNVNWQSKPQASYMDKSLQINADTILENVKQVMATMKENASLRELNKKLIMAVAAYQTAMVANPAFAEGGPELAKQLNGQVSYSKFLEGVKEHIIERVRVEPNGRTADFITTEGARGQVELFNDPEFLKQIQENGIDLYVMNNNSAQNDQLFSIFTSFIVPGLILAAIFFFTRRGDGGVGISGGMNQFNMGKSKARIQMEPDTGVNFEGVAGVDEAKEELMEIVDFLKTPQKFTELGAKVPRGALLIGPPGTGKTLLAKAVAGEAGVPFLSISASEFVEMFVGVGASRVRDMFEQAKKNAPCIVFIDELDSVGRQRNQGLGMGNDEREQTINQLLTEMDGFEGNTGVIVLAATNIPDVLDKALLRPGRFDRQITVSLPDAKGRTKILQVHAKDKPLGEDVNLQEIAKRCMGMSGADLQNVLNEAAILSARRKKQIIEAADVYDSIDRIQIGLEKKGAEFSEKRQKLVAYHEGGHALLGCLMEDYDLVNKISIVPRGGTGGVTIFTPEEEAMESGMYSKEYLENRICVALGGRIAEEIINGKDQVTTGASNDFQQCTNTAKMMVEQMGMSDVIGPRNVQPPGGSMYGGQTGAVQGSIIKEKVDKEIDRILDEQYERGMKLLTDNRDVLDEIAKFLIEEEKIDGKQLLQLIKNIRPELVTEKAIEAIESITTPIGAKSPAPQEAA